MGKLVVVTGPPGAGKSTVAALVADRFDPSALVPGDDFFAFLRTGAIAPWLPEAAEQNLAVARAAAAATGRLTTYCDVVYDGVALPWFLRELVRQSPSAEVHYAALIPPLEVCLHRVATRTGHGFTDLPAAERMWHEFDRAGIDARHVFDEPVPPDELAARIAERVASAAIRYPSAGSAAS